jgi:hypothetical protein
MTTWQPGVAAALVAVLLSGCATHVQPIWTGRHGPIGDEGQDQFRRDVYRCTQESRTVASGGGSGLIGIAIMASVAQQAQAQANNLYLMCMDAAGYRRMSEAELQYALEHGYGTKSPAEVKALVDAARKQK